MGVLKSTVMAIDNYLRRSGGRDQGTRPAQAFRDAGMEAGSFSVEAQAAQTLSDLALGGFQFQMTGSSERARILDRAADEFDRRHAVPVMERGMLWGDCIVVPVWDGERFDHAVVDVCDFRILGCRGDEITHVAYVVERKTVGTQQYALVQEMRLVERAGETSAEMRLTALSQSGSAVDMARFPDWAGYDREWSIAGARHLPIARYRSPKRQADTANGVYGTPICHGASRALKEIHYLVEQQHAEFELSEKSIIADKSLFKRHDGALSLPRGKERVFMQVNGVRNIDETALKTWAPNIQYDPYAEAVEQQLRAVERAIGVDSGILSKPENVNYENVDSVRKSMRKTQAFIDAARGCMETCLDQLVAAWNVLLDYHGVPTGEAEHAYTWSNDYINTYADQRAALAAGFSMGATDALDYRVFVMGEPVEEARARVAEIAAGREAAVLLTE